MGLRRMTCDTAGEEDSGSISFSIALLNNKLQLLSRSPHEELVVSSLLWFQVFLGILNRSRVCWFYAYALRTGSAVETHVVHFSTFGSMMF